MTAVSCLPADLLLVSSAVGGRVECIFPEFWLYLSALSLISHEIKDRLEGFLEYFSKALE